MSSKSGPVSEFRKEAFSRIIIAAYEFSVPPSLYKRTNFMEVDNFSMLPIFNTDSKYEENARSLGSPTAMRSRSPTERFPRHNFGQVQDQSLHDFGAFMN